VLSLHRGLQAIGHYSNLFVGLKKNDNPNVTEIPYRRGLPGARRVARSIEKKLGWQDIYNPSFRNLVNLIPKNTDIVHFHSLWGAGGFADLGAIPAITKRCPGVITMRDTWLLTGHCAYFHKCERWKFGCGQCPDLKLAPSIPKDGTSFNWGRKKIIVSRSSLHVVAISDYLAKLAKLSPILANKPITRIYNGIDLNIFEPVSSEEKIFLRKKLSIPKNALTILLAGQTVEGIKEGIATHYAVEALNRLPKNSIVPIIVGYSASKVSEQIIHSSVVLPFQYTQEDMATCYQASDLCLVTSEVEAFGRIGAEAQACGIPVVAFDSWAIPEVVKNNVGGLIVPFGDVEDLAASIQSLAINSERRSEMAINGHLYVKNLFDQEKVAGEYVKLYRKILSGAQNI
jgi:glycosyltransferase involved in cell wall biosynthesis